MELIYTTTNSQYIEPTYRDSSYIIKSPVQRPHRQRSFIQTKIHRTATSYIDIVHTTKIHRKASSYIDIVHIATN